MLHDFESWERILPACPIAPSDALRLYDQLIQDTSAAWEKANLKLASGSFRGAKSTLLPDALISYWQYRTSRHLTHKLAKPETVPEICSLYRYARLLDKYMYLSKSPDVRSQHTLFGCLATSSGAEPFACIADYVLQSAKLEYVEFPNMDIYRAEEIQYINQNIYSPLLVLSCIFRQIAFLFNDDELTESQNDFLQRLVVNEELCRSIGSANNQAEPLVRQLAKLLNEAIESCSIQQMLPLCSLPNHRLVNIGNGSGDLQREYTLDKHLEHIHINWFNLQEVRVHLQLTEPHRNQAPAEPAPLPTETKQSEGEKPNTDVGTESILPALLSASDIANRIKRKPKSVSSFLSRLAEKKRDCRIVTESKRKNEAAYMYRTAEVWPALEKWMKDDTAS